MKPISQVLNEAATLIETKGWKQHGETSKTLRTRGLCMSSAIYNIEERLKPHDMSRCRIPILLAIGEKIVLNDYGPPIYKYNDTPGRTKEEVLALLRAVAATEYARETSLQDKKYGRSHPNYLRDAPLSPIVTHVRKQKQGTCNSHGNGIN